jgi:hypothetical protein
MIFDIFLLAFFIGCFFFPFYKDFLKKPPTLYLIRGIPGSGKSTLAEKMSREKGGIPHFEVDHYMMNDNGEYEWSQERVEKALGLCNQDIYDQMIQHKSVIMAAVFGRWKSMREYVEWESLAAIRSSSLPVWPSFRTFTMFPLIRWRRSRKNLFLLAICHITTTFSTLSMMRGFTNAKKQKTY